MCNLAPFCIQNRKSARNLALEKQFKTARLNASTSIRLFQVGWRGSVGIDRAKIMRINFGGRFALRPLAR